MKKPEKIIILTFLCCVLLALLGGIVCKIDKDYIKSIDVSEASTEYPLDYTAYIDSVDYSNDRLVVKGWVARKANFNANFQCLIKDEQGIFYAVTTRSVKRYEITQYFNDGNDYSDAGFFATGKVKYGKIKGISQIYILVKDKEQNQYLIETDKTINLG